MADRRVDRCGRCGATLGDVRDERRRKWLSGYATKREATSALNEALGKIQSGAYVPPSDQTLAEFIEEWLPTARSRVRLSTFESYAMNLRTHVLPRLGTTRLRDLTPGMLNGLYADLGRQGGNGRLSDRTVGYIAMILRRALKDAVRWGRIGRNPGDLADPPRVRTSEPMKTWTAEQLGQFLDSVADDRLYAAYVVLATTGMRRGEALGLRWEDFDADRARVSISRALISANDGPTFSDPKTGKGRRSISLDADTVAVLRQWKRQQAGERLQWGPAYQDNGLVFCQEDGQPLDPGWFTAAFLSRAARAGVPRIRLHDLRHTCATIALAAGVHPKIVSERLGHAKIAITLDTYSHVIPAMETDAADRIAALILRARRSG
jgi:integrase